MPKTTVQLFCNDDGKDCPQDHHPPWREGWNADRQQQASQQCGVIRKNARDRHFTQRQDQRFCRECTDATENNLQQRPPAKKPELNGNAWQCGQADQHHDA
ncbi:hypothetical protein D3C80_1735850 [compost metagenome]